MFQDQRRRSISFTKVGVKITSAEAKSKAPEVHRWDDISSIRESARGNLVILDRSGRRVLSIDLSKSDHDWKSIVGKVATLPEATRVPPPSALSSVGFLLVIALVCWGIGAGFSWIDADPSAWFEGFLPGEGLGNSRGARRGRFWMYIIAALAWLVAWVVKGVAFVLPWVAGLIGVMAGFFALGGIRQKLTSTPEEVDRVWELRAISKDTP